jgi:hypothetical protein
MVYPKMGLKCSFKQSKDQIGFKVEYIEDVEKTVVKVTHQQGIPS